MIKVDQDVFSYLGVGRLRFELAFVLDSIDL